MSTPSLSRIRSRSVVTRLAQLGVAGVLLTSCTTSAVPSATPLTGVPSIGISVPLQRIGCTLSNTCVALGANNAGVGPSTVAEYRATSGRWVGLVTPSSVAAQFNTASCWASDCLIGGAEASGNLLWDFHAPSHLVTALAGPIGGVDLVALDCVAVDTCIALDFDAGGALRLSSTLDGGTTWTTPGVIAWAQGDSIGALACHSTNDCLVGVNTASGGVVLKVTHDGGTTWSALDAAASWRSLDAMTCRTRSCVALVTRGGVQRLVRSTTFGQTWRGADLTARASALACTSLRRCVLVGASTTGVPWLAQVSGEVVTVRSLKYVPTPLVDVACGTTACAAVAVTTVLALRP